MQSKKRALEVRCRMPPRTSRRRGRDAHAAPTHAQILTYTVYVRQKCTCEFCSHAQRGRMDLVCEILVANNLYLFSVRLKIEFYQSFIKEALLVLLIKLKVPTYTYYVPM